MAITATGNTKTTLDGLYKIVYPKGFENVIPEQAILQSEIEFGPYIGEYFTQPIQLSLPGGVTYGGENTTTASGAYTLLGAVAGLSVKTKVTGCQMTVQETVGYGACKSARGGPESFKAALGHIFEGMTMVGRRRIEQELIHGQSLTGMGVVTVATNACTISEATWAPGCFVGSAGHYAMLAESGCALIRTSTVDSHINSVNFATRTVNFHTIPTSGATGDILLWEGNLATASAWKTCMGIVPAIDTSGTVWNQTNVGYEMHKGEEKDVGSTDLSFDAISDLLGQMFVKGASGKFTLYCSPHTWTNLISPEVAVRRHDASYKPEKVKVGNEAIEFHHLLGTLTVKAHPMCKEGEAFIINPSLWQRIGSTDLTFEQDVGANSKRIFLHLADKNGFEVRAYSDQAPFTRRLGWTGLLYNIVNS